MLMHSVSHNKFSIVFSLSLNITINLNHLLYKKYQNKRRHGNRFRNDLFVNILLFILFYYHLAESWDIHNSIHV